jgi:hypothetical protein
LPLLGSNSRKWSECKNIFRLDVGADLDFIRSISIMLHPGNRGRPTVVRRFHSSSPIRERSRGR